MIPAEKMLPFSKWPLVESRVFSSIGRWAADDYAKALRSQLRREHRGSGVRIKKALRGINFAGERFTFWLVVARRRPT
jgi:hypothetical protein